MREVNLQTITRDISSYIHSKVIDITKDDNKWKEYYDSIIEQLKSEIHQTKEVIADYNDNNLTINRIEQEGYLRALITMVNQFEQYIP